MINSVHQSFIYGSSYTEKIIEKRGKNQKGGFLLGTFKPKTPTKHAKKYEKEKNLDHSNSTIVLSFGSTYEYQSGFSMNVHEGNTKTYHYGDAHHESEGTIIDEHTGDIAKFVKGNIKKIIEGSTDNTVTGSEFNLYSGDKTIKVKGAQITSVSGDAIKGSEGEIKTFANKNITDSTKASRKIDAGKDITLNTQANLIAEAKNSATVLSKNTDIWAKKKLMLRNSNASIKFQGPKIQLKAAQVIAGALKVIDSADSKALNNRLKAIENDQKRLRKEIEVKLKLKDDLWSEHPVVRGILIQRHLSETDYKDWKNMDDQINPKTGKPYGNYKLVDFQKGDEAVSLKTVDTKSSGWEKRMEDHLFDLSEEDLELQDGSTPNKTTLDVRVQPGGLKAAEAWADQARDDYPGVEITVSEF